MINPDAIPENAVLYAQEETEEGPRRTRLVEKAGTVLIFPGPHDPHDGAPNIDDPEDGRRLVVVTYEGREIDITGGE